MKEGVKVVSLEVGQTYLATRAQGLHDLQVGGVLPLGSGVHPETS